jgi:hypothetical protein
MFDVIQTWPRYVLSRLIQFLTGNALASEWFKDQGIKKDEHYNCGCGKLETINHIIKKCRKRSEERKKLKSVLPTLFNS